MSNEPERATCLCSRLGIAERAGVRTGDQVDATSVHTEQSVGILPTMATGRNTQRR